MLEAMKARIQGAKVRLRIQGDEWSEADVRIAAATKLKALHPDTSGVEHVNAGTEIARLKADKALLIKYATPDQVNRCPHCGGTGYVSD